MHLIICKIPDQTKEIKAPNKWQLNTNSNSINTNNSKLLFVIYYENNL